jgi:hypothetical protein
MAEMFFRPLQWPQIYYGGTVLFALADWGFGENVRAVGLASYPGLKTGYYGGCILCAILVRSFPHWSALITLSESTVNLVTLMLSILLPYYSLLESPGNLQALTESPITPNLVMNFMIAGGVSVAVFYQCLLPSTR